MAVTGGATGFGAELLAQLRDLGAQAVSLDVKPGGVACDVRFLGDVKAAITTIEQTYGPVDIAIANAAIDLTAPTHHLSSDDWMQVLDVNLRGAVNLLQSVYPAMVARGAGQILFVSLGAARIGFPFGVPYSTSKGAISNLARSLRAEAAPLGVKINLVELPVLEGGLMTNTAATDGTDRQAYLNRVRGERTTLETAARLVIDGLKADKARIVFPRTNALSYWLADAFPLLGHAIRADLVRAFHDSQPATRGADSHSVKD
ncbi:MAG: SDR family NAD(P)-dependent oxidoreductase [Pseudomonadota bacterium]